MSPKYAALAASLLLALSLPAVAQYMPQDPFGPPSAQGPRSGTTDRSESDDQNARWNTASLSGAVVDMKGNPVDDARVELRELPTTASVTTTYTTSNGFFEFRNLRPRAYELVITCGLTETRQRVEVNNGDFNVTVRFPSMGPDNSRQSTVSVADMKVPDKAKSELRKAEGNMDRNKLAEARKHLEKAITIYPRYGKANMLLGLVDLQEQRVQDATTALEKSVEYDSNNPMAFVALASLYNLREQYQDAIRALDSGTRLSPSAWQIHFEMAKARLGLQEFSAALEQAEKAEQLCRFDFPMIHLVKAHALLGLKDYPKASVALEQYIRHAPQNATTVEARRTLEQVRAFTTARK